MRIKSSELKNIQLMPSKKESLLTRKSSTKKQVKENTEIIAKFAAQLLLLIFLIGLIIFPNIII